MLKKSYYGDGLTHQATSTMTLKSGSWGNPYVRTSQEGYYFAITTRCHSAPMVLSRNASWGPYDGSPGAWPFRATNGTPIGNSQSSKVGALTDHITIVATFLFWIGVCCGGGKFSY